MPTPPSSYKKKQPRSMIEKFFDEYSGRAEARRVKEAAKKKPKKRTAVETQTRSVVPSMSSYRVQALEQENHALRLQLAAQQYQRITVTTDHTTPVVDFEKEYNRPEVVEEDVPKGRKIVLD